MQNLQSVKQRFGIIGSSDALDASLEIAIRVAPTDLSVMVTGESGVGKEFFPQIIHAYSARKHNKYIAVNCGAIPEGTIDSELFGHERGSFTGATEARKGYFEEADKGTIFLDEVAELPLSTQVRLLRVLQTGEYIKVGSSKTEKTNVRVVAATNINLQEAVNSGKFREDLYYRLNTVPIFVPPLRERREDIYVLFRRFATDIALQYKMPVIELDEQARGMLEKYSWAGNIRQLKNVAEQISAIEESREINATILKKYLPVTDATPMRMAGGRSQDQQDRYGGERDILYRVLFDMRSDVSEIKRMLTDVILAQSGVAGVAPQAVSNLLPPSRSYPLSLPTDSMEPEEIVGEDVTHQPQRKLTKEEAEREKIMDALKRHNGKRKDAAKELYISERTLYRKLKEHDITEI